ncbi:LOW QUALITY PROTEIN: olfactory receptor 5V1-like [Rhinophrynus dorsalis]
MMDEESKNCTLQRKFYLLAFSRYTEFKFLIFIGVFLMYLLAMLGNVIIIVLVCLVSLHTPMYFFLCNLSVQDIGYVTAIHPKLLDITLTSNTSISFPGCITQMFLFILFGGTEYLLLASMAFDRYVAICIPLRYPVIMKKRVCALLATFSWSISALNSMMLTLLFSKLSFHSSQEINHFFCEIKTILMLSCNSIIAIMCLMFVIGILFGIIPFVLILGSYMSIISTILKISTSAGRLKAFSSCSSHLTVVVLFCGTALGMYMKPENEHSREQDKQTSMLFVAIVPLLNPLVYSLRNSDVLKALKKILKTQTKTF